MSASSIGELLRDFLLADATVAGLVVTRAWPLRLPQKPTLPAIVITRISGLRIGNLRGPASAAEPRYQIDSWSTSVKGALELGQAVRRRLEGYVGVWTESDSPSPIAVSVAIRLIDERDEFQEEINGGLCRHSADYFVFHGTQSGLL